jgi:ATP-dependent Clp protease protease subunit
MMIIPTVIETTARGERAYDIYSRLLRDRIVFVGDEIDDDLANAVTAQLLFLENDDSEKDIIMYINTPGGSVTSALAIYDVMQYIAPNVGTICLGMAASGGSLLLAAGHPGMRMALTNSMIMVHQPWAGGIKGQATDLEVAMRQIMREKNLLIDIYTKHCNKPREEVAAGMERDNFMTSQQAIEWGLIDSIIEKPVKPGAGSKSA